MPSQMTPTPVVQLITDRATGRLVGIDMESFRAFERFMNMMEPLYKVTTEYCLRINATLEQRLMIHLNAQADHGRKMRDALVTHTTKHGFPAPMFEVTAEGMKLAEDFDTRLQNIHAVERIMCQIENGQKELALESCLALRSRLTSP